MNLSDVMSWIISASGLAATVAAAIAGIWKFWAWTKDRKIQAQIESATYFRDKGKQSWQVDFGEKRLARIHFARLTTVDIDNGHDAIARLHTKMGGLDYHWSLLGKIRRYLRKEGQVARIRKLRRKDLIWAISSSLIGVGLCLGSFALIALMAVLSMKSHWTQMPLKDFFAIAMIGAYAGMFFTAGIVLVFYTGEYLDALTLRRRFLKPRFKRMQQYRASVQSSCLAKAASQLSGTAPVSASGNVLSTP